MKEKNHMTRTCSACGIEKPLAAFLELSTTQGTHYGTICAACRSAGKTEKKISPTENEQGTTSNTGVRIGLKERVFQETEQKKQETARKEERVNQLIKRDLLHEEKTEKTLLKEKSEKDHRKNYLELKTQPGFLGQKLPPKNTPPTPPQSEQQVKHQSMLKEEEKKRNAKEANQEKEAIRQETKAKEFNLTDQFVDAQTGEIRAHTPTFLAFQDSLEVTPFKTMKERLRKLKSRQAATAPQKEKNTKDPLVNFIEENWSKPGPTRKR